MGLRAELGFPNPIEHPAHEALMSLVLTGTMLSKEGDAILRPFRLSASQFNLLMTLAYQSEDGHLSQTEIGRMLLVNRANVTGLVDRMERAGWVARGAHTSDRRINLVGITAEGRRLLRKAEKAYLDGVEKVMSSLEEDERIGLCGLLEKIRASISRDTSRNATV